MREKIEKNIKSMIEETSIELLKLKLLSVLLQLPKQLTVNIFV